MKPLASERRVTTCQLNSCVKFKSYDLLANKLQVYLEALRGMQNDRAFILIIEFGNISNAQMNNRSESGVHKLRIN